MEIPQKLDDLDLSPEAYRLYLHLKRMTYGGPNVSTFIINKPIVAMLYHCKIPCDPIDLSCGKFFMELANHHVIDFEINLQTEKGRVLSAFDIALSSVTFLPVENWI